MDGNHLGGLDALFPFCDIVVGYGSSFIKQANLQETENTLRDILVFSQDRIALVNMLYETRVISPSCRYFSHLVDPEILFFADTRFGTRRRYKIGIIQTDRGLKNISEWDDSFYIAGRFQKPVRLLRCADKSLHARFDESSSSNHVSALNAALIMISNGNSESFSISSLLTSLISLSYMGDVRMTLAENPMKIANIVEGQKDELERIYKPYFDKVGIKQISGGELRCSKSPSELWSRLPRSFTRSAVQLADPREALVASLKQVNRRESINQALVGMGTTGICKSMNYLARKISKRFF